MRLSRRHIFPPVWKRALRTVHYWIRNTRWQTTDREHHGFRFLRMPPQEENNNDKTKSTGKRKQEQWETDEQQRRQATARATRSRPRQKANQSTQVRAWMPAQQDLGSQVTPIGAKGKVSQQPRPRKRAAAKTAAAQVVCFVLGKSLVKQIRGFFVFFFFIFFLCRARPTPPTTVLTSKAEKKKSWFFFIFLQGIIIFFFFSFSSVKLRYICRCILD